MIGSILLMLQFNFESQFCCDCWHLTLNHVTITRSYWHSTQTNTQKFMRVQFRKIVDIFGYNDQLNALLLQFKIRNTHTRL